MINEAEYSAVSKGERNSVGIATMETACGLQVHRILTRIIAVLDVVSELDHTKLIHLYFTGFKVVTIILRMRKTLFADCTSHMLVFRC